MASIASRDISSSAIASSDIGSSAVGLGASTTVYDWGGQGLTATTGDAATFPTVGDADANRQVLDWEDRWIPVLAEELRYNGWRRVENLITASEDLENAAWVRVNATISSGADDPDGGASAYTLTATSIDGRIGQNSLVSSGSTAQTSCWIKRRTGSGDIKFLKTNGGLTSALGVTTSWKRFALGSADLVAASSGTFYVWIEDSGDEIDIWHPQVEDVTGQSDQNPAEYVSTGVESAPYHGWNVDGVKYFATENGNTVSSNVVTEATGSAIASATLKEYFAEGAATELSGYSQDLTNWALSGTPTVAQDAVGLDGTDNTAFTVGDDDGAAAEHIYNNTTVSDDSSDYYVVTRIAYDASPTVYPKIDFYFYGGTIVRESLIFDPSDGSYNENDTDGAIVSVTRIGDFWNLVLSLSNNSTGNTGCQLRLYAAWNADGTVTKDNSVTGSTVIASAELYKTNYSFSPILTSGGTTKTRLADTEMTLPYDLGDIADAGSVEFEFTPYHDDAPGYQYIFTPAAGFRGIMLHNTVPGSFQLRDGTNTAAYAPGITIETTVTVKWRWGSSTQNFSVDGTKATETSYDGDYDFDAIVTLLGSYSRGAALKSLVVYNEDNGTDWLEE